MADEPTLPPLDSRKRGRNMGPPPSNSSPSSDPAFFSSDDDPALDNYQAHGRRKKRYVGAWFDQQPASSDSAVGEETRPTYPPPRRNRGPPQPQKREFKRQLDSGVWMGTDGALTDTDDSFDLEPAAARFPLAPPRAQPSVPLSPARPRFTSQEQEVQKTIRFCVDNGSEQVDLSGLGLETISEGLLDPIADICPIPTVAKDVAFEQREPEVKVFLSNNRLRSFPVALLNVEHLTVLTLRANRLVRIPPAISKLKNLEALNIAQNYLRFLPGELLGFLQRGGKPRTLNIQPNRFWQPDTAWLNNAGAEQYERLTFGAQPEAIIGSSWSGLTTKLHSRTPVHFLDSAQKAYSTFTLPPLDSRPSSDILLELEPFTSLATPRERASELRSHASTSKVVNPKGAKSLFELALRACATSAQAEHILPWLRQDESLPPHFAPAVERAADIYLEGGAECAVCRRETLMPLAQWVEFRQLGRTTVVVDAEGQKANMRLHTTTTALLASLLLLPTATAVFRDEVGHIDYHHRLLGLPQRETTFFHRPRPDDRASLLYTLSDVGVVGAVNPGSGEVVWRQDLRSTLTTTTTRENNDNVGGGFMRAGEGEGWVVSAYGGAVHAWDAVSGRNKFWAGFEGATVRDLEVMEMTESGPGRKDVLVLLEKEGGGGETVLRRLSAEDGSVVWEFRAVTKDVPLQVSTNVEKVFVVSLKGAAAGAYNLKVSVLDTLTGKKVDEMVIGAKADVHGKEDVMFVGANSAAPIVAWTDDARKTLSVNVLGTKTKQEFALPADTIEVEIHAPHLVQSEPHFLVHSKTPTGHRGEVFHVDLKTNAISKAYALPIAPGPGSFSTSSDGANVYFTRITEDEVILLSSQSHGVLARWPLKTVSEVIKKSGSEDSYAVRAAAVTDADDWVLIRNGEVGWTRPEGMTGGVAATFAEIPESEDLARSLEQEAHSNPLEAYMHRVKRHINDLQYLPAWIDSLPPRFMSSISGKDVPASTGKLARDSFGFHKLVVLATRRGMLLGSTWDVKGIQVQDSTGQVTILGSHDDFVVLKTDTGEIIEAKGPGPEVTTQGAALVDTHSGQQLIRIGRDGKIGELPVYNAPRQTVVTRGADGELKGVVFVPQGTTSHETTSWTFSPPQSQRIVNIATRSAHDAVASIGRVLGDRTVKYKYLNPNTLVVAAVDDSAHSLTVYLLDTVSGQILSSSKYDGIDLTKPIECAMSENWFVCTFFGQHTLRDNPTKSLKGYQIVVSDLYESDEPNSRGPLGDADSFSPLDPIDVPTGGIIRPSVVSQSYVISAPISALQVTQTRQGVTARQVLAYLPESHGIVGIPRIVIEPRRPIGRDPTAAEAEEGLIRYQAAVEIDPKSVISHERDVLGVEKIITAPAIVESTSLVFAYGVDVFGTRVAPSFMFDILGKGFNKVALVATVLALSAGVMMLAPMVRRKQINMRWRAQM
ncbi:hypothetical protein C8A00DRAFT_42051 [Chaetomidium leptoderma]|uniref:ER membrane protein complex subunit 1 n=1 Tax=Chaetomidium leptoderma TaxID=669021 RepID=A0AAN6ZY99_9PEZI|nr:hypothetical protein C8A00DRAFT_42051 [Chaetomidium leptoderma]